MDKYYEDALMTSNVVVGQNISSLDGWVVLSHSSETFVGQFNSEDDAWKTALTSKKYGAPEKIKSWIEQQASFSVFCGEAELLAVNRLALCGEAYAHFRHWYDLCRTLKSCGAPSY